MVAFGNRALMREGIDRARERADCDVDAGDDAARRKFKNERIDRVGKRLDRRDEAAAARKPVLRWRPKELAAGT